MNGDNGTYFDSIGVEHIPKEIKRLKSNKNITTDIFRIQVYDSIVCGYFYVGFTDFMLKYRSLLQYVNSFSPNEYEQNDKIILKYFQYFENEKNLLRYLW